jgi:hypothetical protein
VGLADLAFDPTLGSKNVRETVPAPSDQVRTALKLAMESVGCKVRLDEQPSNQPARMRCERDHAPSERFGRGGSILATITPDGTRTSLYLQAKPTAPTSKNWVGPVYRQLLTNLGASTAIKAKP